MSTSHKSRIERRKRRVSANIHGTKERPRISIYRSNKYIYAQAINDVAAKTLASFSSLGLKKTEKKTKTDVAREVGMKLAELLTGLKIKQVVFDRNRYAYNGRVN